MSTSLEFLFHRSSRDRRAHPSREPTFAIDRPSGSRERRVEEEVVFRYTAPGGGTAAVPRVVKPRAIIKDRRAHRSREPTFDPPSGSRERRVEEEVVLRSTAPGGGTAAVPRVVKSRAIIKDRRAHRSREPTSDRPSGSRERRVEEKVVFRYTAAGGGTAAVPRVVKPYQVLQVTQNASRAIIKAAFKRAANYNRRQERVMASLSYHILMSEVERYQKKSDGSYKITKKDDVFVLAAVGDTASLLAQISKDSSLATCTDEHNHSVLYLTARAGFYDTTEALLKIGVSVNEQQVDGSTALHAACFYGQRPVVELLLRYGADAAIKNKWGYSPADEAASAEIKQVILSYKEDRISQIVSSLVGKGLASGVRLIKRNGIVVGREVLRHRNAIDQRTRLAMDSITSRWVNVWHGTKAKYLESILRYGLKPSGSTLPDGSKIKPPSNHYKLGKTHFGITNWANAIFLSPSIPYASHACYSERIFSGNNQWCIMVRARVKPDAYTMHEPTVYRGDPIDGEPDTPEFRIEASSEDKIMRVEAAGNVVVTSIVFISLNFLENTPNLTFDQLNSLFEMKNN